MKLTDLHPAWEKHGEYRHLAFDCPACKTHRLEIPVPPHPRAWAQTGEDFASITLHPSILHTNHDADDHYETGKPIRVCVSHFWIREGGIEMA